MSSSQEIDSNILDEQPLTFILPTSITTPNTSQTIPPNASGVRKSKHLLSSKTKKSTIDVSDESDDELCPKDVEIHPSQNLVFSDNRSLDLFNSKWRNKSVVYGKHMHF